jgi:hypothetical protein
MVDEPSTYSIVVEMENARSIDRDEIGIGLVALAREIAEVSSSISVDYLRDHLKKREVIWLECPGACRSVSRICTRCCFQTASHEIRPRPVF